MLKKLWPYAIRPTSLLATGLLLAACNATPTPVAQEKATVAQTVAATTVASTTEPTKEAATATQETSPTATAVTQSGNTASTAVAIAGPPKPAACQPVQIIPNTAVAPVSDADWAKGPATAAITVIEYGDFQ